MPTMNLRSLIRSDITANRGYPKSIVILTTFRIAHHLKHRREFWARIAYVPVAIFYKLFTEWLLGVEIPVATVIGPGLQLRHGVGVVINPFVVIGSDVMIRQNVTLGNRYEEDDTPIIGDRVQLGAGAIIIGKCTVGAGARIAAGAVVIHDVPVDGIAYPAAATIKQGRSSARSTS